MLPSGVPVAVSGLSSGVATLTAGYLHTCAATTSGAVQCWGDNSFGQLGDGSMMQRNTPVAVAGLSSDVARVVAGDNYTCALMTAGNVRCWGSESSVPPSLLPTSVPGLSIDVAALSAQGEHSCVLTNAGRAQCWGRDTQGELGDGSTKDSPVPVDVVEP
jgi:alpha-tubulin suppressor-like RCC1 family protein